MDMLSKNGFKPFEREHPKNYKNNCVYRQHIEEDSLDSLKDGLARGYNIIVPLRHPMLCAQSWTNRRKPIDGMLQQWEWLLDIVAPYKPMYLPIDSPEKSQYLEIIEARTKILLRTEWPIIGAKPCSYPMKNKDKTKVSNFVRSARFRETLGLVYPNPRD